MLADDFARFISLEAPRTGIPACDDAPGVQHVDGIVRHRLDQEAVAFICSAGRPVVFHRLVGQVPAPSPESRFKHKYAPKPNLAEAGRFLSPVLPALGQADISQSRFNREAVAQR